MDNYKYIIALYFIAIFLITILVTVADKILAIKNKRRVSEAALITLAILGGAIPEYLTMIFIHHKTRHKKFMVGLPIIIFVEVILVYLVVRYFYFN